LANTLEEASHFLMQSTLGANYNLISSVASYASVAGKPAGIQSWLHDQLNNTVTTTDGSVDTPTNRTDTTIDTFQNRVTKIWEDFKIQAIKESADDGNGSVIGAGNATLPYNFYWRMGWWQRTLCKDNPNANPAATYTQADRTATNISFNTATSNELNNENLVRHRVAQALSEILVISDKSVLELDAVGMASFYDILYEGAFGTYADMLKKVSLHPMMGVFLTHLNNKKENGNQHPDENYAREIMQLFTIGLNELNNNGSEKTDADGNFIPTYGNNDIKQLARVFTGLKGSRYNYEWPAAIAGFNAIQNTAINLTTATNKTHITIPFIDMVNPMIEEVSLHDGGAVTLFSGKSTQITIGAGNLDTQVTQAVDKLVAHPNTAPFIAKKLIQQLVTSNPSTTYINDVANAFKTNPKGDLKATISAILLHSEATSSSAQKLKSPLLRVTQLLRAFNVKNSSKKFWFRGDMVDMKLQQHVLSSPTVFNFYLPNYAPHGEIEDANQVAPEFQLHNSATSIGYSNMMYDLLFTADNKLSITVPSTIDNPNFFKTSDTTLAADKLEFDFTAEKALVTINTGAGIENLIKRVSLILTGSETCSIQSEIKNTLDTKIGYSNLDWVVQTVVFLIVSTPQYTIQMKR
jgi:uncharacterized protein (DUF1800 family)